MGRPAKFTPEQVEEFKKMHAAGASLSDLAIQYKVSKATMSKYLKNA
jgi:DNA invertase Pin-like site-specific DNA recombinase